MVEDTNCVKHANRSHFLCRIATWSQRYILTPGSKGRCNHSFTLQLNRASSPGEAAGPLMPCRNAARAIRMFPAANTTEEKRTCSHSSHVQITPSRSCGWVGGDREIREILDLLDVSAPSSVEWFFFPYLPWFLLLSFLLACMQKCSECAGDCARRISSVLHWSNFRTHHAPHHHHQRQTRVYFVQDSCQIVRWGWETMEMR